MTTHQLARSLGGGGDRRRGCHRKPKLLFMASKVGTREGKRDGGVTLRKKSVEHAWKRSGNHATN